MLKGQKKNIDKEQGKTKHEAPRSVTQNKNNIGTTAFERLVVYTTGGFKGLSLYKLHPVYTYKFGSHNGFLTHLNASRRKYKTRIAFKKLVTARLA